MGLRLATADDANALAGLHASAFESGWTAGSLTDLLDVPGTFAFLAEEDGAPQGFVLVRAAGGEAEILSVAVLAESRRYGLGRRLVKACAAKAWAMEAKTLFLEVSVDNAPALRFYESLGFVCVGRRQAYYIRGNRPPADALTLKVDLPLASSGALSRLGKGAQLD